MYKESGYIGNLMKEGKLHSAQPLEMEGIIFFLFKINFTKADI
jgi:hypothetical protein